MSIILILVFLTLWKKKYTYGSERNNRSCLFIKNCENSWISVFSGRLSTIQVWSPFSEVMIFEIMTMKVPIGTHASGETRPRWWDNFCARCLYSLFRSSLSRVSGRFLVGLGMWASFDKYCFYNKFVHLRSAFGRPFFWDDNLIWASGRFWRISSSFALVCAGHQYSGYLRNSQIRELINQFYRSDRNQNDGTRAIDPLNWAGTFGRFHQVSRKAHHLKTSNFCLEINFLTLVGSLI